MEVNRVDVAGRHGRQVESLARRIRACEIETDMVPHDESDDGQGDVIIRADTDAYDDARRWFENIDRLSRGIEHRNSENLRAAVTEAMIHIGNRVNNLGRGNALVWFGLGLTVRARDVGVVFLDHRCGILSRDDIRVAEFLDASALKP